MVTIELNNLTRNKIARQLVENVLKRTLEILSVAQADLSIALVGDDRMKILNQTYRHKNKTTDVLSFDFGSTKNCLTGEIIISLSQAKRQAKAMKATFKDELIRLLVHGVVHLAGYDHEQSAKAEKKMQAMENKILIALN
jgi:probable rRNA maturation factor